MRDRAAGLSRREILIAGSVLLGSSVASWPLARHARAQTTATSLEAALEHSEFVYVSPLRSDGEESRCHGEVWYGRLDGSVVLITSSKSWKARALAKGLTSARIWVGNHGRWKGLLTRNEEFRKAPHFDARVERSRDGTLLDRLLALYETKYPREIGDWRDRMRDGFADGSRLLLRYTAV